MATPRHCVNWSQSLPSQSRRLLACCRDAVVDGFSWGESRRPYPSSLIGIGPISTIRQNRFCTSPHNEWGSRIAICSGMTVITTMIGIPCVSTARWTLPSLVRFLSWLPLTPAGMKVDRDVTGVNHEAPNFRTWHPLHLSRNDSIQITDWSEGPQPVLSLNPPNTGNGMSMPGNQPVAPFPKRF